MGCGNAFAKLSINARSEMKLQEYHLHYSNYNRVDWFESACALISRMTNLSTLFVTLDKDKPFTDNECEAISKLLINMFDSSHTVQTLILQGRMEIFDMDIWSSYWQQCHIHVKQLLEYLFPRWHQ